MCPTIMLMVLTLSVYPALISARMVVDDEPSTEGAIEIADASSSLETVDTDDYMNTGMAMTREDLTGTVTRLTARLDELETKFKALEGAQASNALNSSVTHAPSVAFYAVNDHGIISHLGINQKIIFGSVLLNNGNGYNPHHGIFTAPTCGLYLFSSSVLSANGASSSLFAADIIVNNQVYARIYGKGASPYHDQGSNTIIVNIKRGDTVAVRLACCAYSGLYGGRYTTFSGVLLN